MSDPTQIVELLLVAAAVALATKYLHLPYTVALVVVGLAIGVSRAFQEIHLSKELILLVFLPPLLFEGALNMELDLLREQWGAILFLAVGCTLVSTLAIGAGAMELFGMPLWPAMLLGAMLAATDPVSVLAIFKELGVPRRLSLVVEGESVFNDGVAVVIFGVIMEHALRASAGDAGGFELAHAAWNFAYVAAGGTVVGLLCGYAAYRLHQRIDDHLLEVMLSLILAYGAFLVAEHLHMSGVLATASSGLVIGNYGRLFAMSPTTRVSLHAFWEVAVFLVNSLVFLLVGIQLVVRDLLDNLGLIAATVVIMTAARAACVYGFGCVRGWGNARYDRRWLHTIFLSGIRGSVPVALVLGLAPAFPGRSALMAVVFGVVLVSLVVQGLLASRWIKGLGLSDRTEADRVLEHRFGRVQALRAGRRVIEDLIREGHVEHGVLEKTRASLDGELATLDAEIGSLLAERPALRARQEAIVRRQVLLAQKAGIADALRRGIVSEDVYIDFVRRLDGEIEAVQVAAAEAVQPE